MINFVHELPHEIPNDFRLRILGNQNVLGGSENCVGAQPNHPQSPLHRSKITKKHYNKIFYGCQILLGLLSMVRSFARIAAYNLRTTNLNHTLPHKKKLKTTQKDGEIL